MEQDREFWKLSVEELFDRLQASENGLNEQEVSNRKKIYGLNIIQKRKINVFTILLRQLTGNPLILILAVATFVSFILGQQISSYYIFGMILLSVFMGLWNEYSSEKTIEDLLKKISQNTVVVRNGEKQEVTVANLTVGDIVLLTQGSIIPADIRFIEVKDLIVNQSALTGESKTLPKTAGVVNNANSSLYDIENLGFMGTNIEAGWGKGLVIKIGKQTEYGKIAKTTTFLKPVTEFQKGLASFGGLIIKVIIILTIAIFGINAMLGHKMLESLSFALAIAVGLTPELLPIIVTVSLSHGAGKLAKKHVVTKRLLSIENLGNMDILCTDKTGTLTEGKIEVVDYLDAKGSKAQNLFKMALLCNAAVIHHKIIGNGIDVALWEYANKNGIKAEGIKKIDEEPFDYSHRGMYAVVEEDEKILLIAKGAHDTILNLCSDFEGKEKLREKFLKLNNQGYRVITIGSRIVPKKGKYSWNDVGNLRYEGYITFLDVPKKTAKDALLKLQNLNVLIKIITGDNEIISRKICNDVGMKVEKVLLGTDFDSMPEQKFREEVNKVNLFAKITPEQKLKIIQALQKNGHTVGYLGDGINDLPSLHGADIGISVDTGVDVAKDSASVVLLRKSLNVIADGIIEGRRTFYNTIKYILMGTSSNFGNMFSAAGASFFLPFLPMAPVQILLTNSLYDISQLSIPSDNVDDESLLKPRHWNINFIKNYMIFFGPLSSIYDFLTFGVMLFIFNAKNGLFQTGWFIESLATEVLVVFVIRTARRPFYKSKPSLWLTLTCLSVVVAGIIIPFSPLAGQLDFVTPPPLYFLILIMLVSTYLLLVESVKSIFLKKFNL